MALVKKCLKGLINPDSVLYKYLKWIGRDCHFLTRFGRGWERLEERPCYLVVELTNICNSNCVFCAYRYQDFYRKERGIMSNELFAKIIDQYEITDGHKYLYISCLSGEPLLDPCIIDKIVYAKKKGFCVSLFTNGTLFNAIDIGAFIDSGLDAVCISTAPLDESCHDLICRSHKYRDLIEGLTRLLEWRTRLKSSIRVCIAFRSHIPYDRVVELNDYKEKIKPLLLPEEIRGVRDSMIVKTFDNWGGQISRNDLPGCMDIAKIPFFKLIPCSWTFGVTILFDGKYRACGCRFTKQLQKDDELIMGNIKDVSLYDIWNGERLKACRRRFKKGKLPLTCRSCTMYTAA